MIAPNSRLGPVFETRRDDGDVAPRFSRGVQLCRHLRRGGWQADALAKAPPVLGSLAASIFQVGPIGSSQFAKLPCPTGCLASETIGLSAIDLGVELGMDRTIASGVAAVSAGTSLGLIVARESLKKFGWIRPGSAMPKDRRHLQQSLFDHGVADQPCHQSVRVSRHDDARR